MHQVNDTEVKQHQRFFLSVDNSKAFLLQFVLVALLLTQK